MPKGDLLRLRFDAFELDEADARLTRAGRPVALAPKAFSVLCALARQSGQLMTKDALLDAVWGHQHVSESVLKTIISELRSALSDDARQPRYIETASRRGYRFIGVARPAPAAEPQPGGRVPPMPPAAPLPDEAHGPPMIGRQAALERLRGAWADASEGRRRIVWITGEAGVGKTTLIESFAAGLGAVRCAHGQCVGEFGAGEPYLPLLEALGALCRNDAALVPLMRAVGPTWLLQLPWLSSDAERDALQRALAGANQDRMLRELGELLDRYAQQQPLLLITEDLHWSDHATVRLIDHVARRRSPARLLWLASFRLAEVVSSDHPLKALRHELRLHRLCEEVALDPFSERELAQYIESRIPGVDAPENLVRALHARTEGLPLFVVNVIDDLAAQGALRAASGAADALAGPLEVPESLAGIIEAQIERLPPEQQALLEAASVCGVEFRAGTVAAALERDAEWVGERCDELARRQHWLAAPALERMPDGFLDGRYAFRHALYQHVFYRRIGSVARARLHRRIAGQMERGRACGLAVTPAELASHYERGQDVPSALRHYADAAASALKHFAPTEALHLTRHGLSLLPHCPEGIERNQLEMALLRPRATALQQLQGAAAAETRAVFERVLALADLLPARTAHGLELGLGWSYFVQGEYGKARALAARIDAAAQDRADHALHVAACNLLGATLCYQGDLAEARQWLEQGLEAFAGLAARFEQAPLVVDLDVAMRTRLSIALLHLGLPDPAQQHSDVALARAASLGQPVTQMLALAYAALLQGRLGRPERALELADAMLKVVSDHALAEGEGPALGLRGWALAHLGQPEAALPLIQQGCELQLQRGNLGGGTTALLGYAAEAFALAGRWPEAQAKIDEALALARRIGEGLFLPDLLLLQERIGRGRDQLDRTPGPAAPDA